MGNLKKIMLIIILTLGIQLISPSIFNVQAIENKALAGDTFKEDVNSDGKIDINDITYVASIYNAQANDGKYQARCDMDNNKIIDVYDLVKISKVIGSNTIPYRVYKEKELIGRYKSLTGARELAKNNKNAYILDGFNKELWRSRYELYDGRTFIDVFNTLNEAISKSSNKLGTYVRDAADNNKVVWQYVDPTVYGIVNTSGSTLNVRSGPGTNYGKIGTLANGTKVIITDSSNREWHKIKYGSGYGFVSKSYIDVQKPIAPPIPPLPGERRIVIDPGHGGSEPGAIGPGGTKEKDIVLKVGLKVRDLLKAKGYDVLMTREKDVFVGLSERREFSNRSAADFFVSIHANAYNSTSNGTETFGNPRFSKSWEFSKLLQKNMVSSFGLRDRGTKDGSNLAVIRENNVPSALVELAFISNPKEEALLKSDSFQNKAAAAIVKSIEESY